MNTKENQMKAPLTEYYDAKDAGDEWELRCKVCRKGWALAKNSEHPGNQLHLLNHAYSHKKPTPAPEER